MKWILAIVVVAGCGPAREASAPSDVGPATTSAAPTSSSSSSSSTPPVTGDPPPRTRALDPALAADLTTMRAHDQHTWSPAAGPAMEAARRVFAAIRFEGMTTAEVEQLIGPPMTKEQGGALWQYYFHNGEMGVVRWLHVADGRVVSVQIVMTQ